MDFVHDDRRPCEVVEERDVSSCKVKGRDDCACMRTCLAERVAMSAPTSSLPILKSVKTSSLWVDGPMYKPTSKYPHYVSHISGQWSERDIHVPFGTLVPSSVRQRQAR